MRLTARAIGRGLLAFEGLAPWRGYLASLVTQAGRRYSATVFDVTGGGPLGKHAVYPGTFDPITPGHLDIIERARQLFARVTVLVAVNADKKPASTQSERAISLRQELPATWDNVSVTAWAGLTVAFCQQHGASVIIRGVRNRSDLHHENQLAAMNESLGITTLLLPAQPELAAISSTMLRWLGT